MRRDEVLRLLAEHKTEIAEFGVKSLALFGSVARDEAAADSDVDILVEFGAPVGMFKFLEVQEFLERVLGRPVDLVMPDAIKPRLRDRILGEAIHAPRDWKVRIDDILDAVAKIGRYLEGMSLESFLADERTIQAVERNYEIIGEAAQHVPPEIQARFPAVPWGRMRGMRNLVAHEYPAWSTKCCGRRRGTTCPNCRPCSGRSWRRNRDHRGGRKLSSASSPSGTLSRRAGNTWRPRKRCDCGAGRPGWCSTRS